MSSVAPEAPTPASPEASVLSLPWCALCCASQTHSSQHLVGGACLLMPPWRIRLVASLEHDAPHCVGNTFLPCPACRHASSLCNLI